MTSSQGTNVERRIHCPRCDKLMEVDRPHRGIVFAYRVWIGLVGVCAVFAPLFIADMVLMLPLMSGVALAGPTLARMAEEPIRCRWCRLALEEPVKSRPRWFARKANGSPGGRSIDLRANENR